MGQTASSIKDAATRQDRDAEKTANDSLTALYDLAKLQIQVFRSTVREDDDRSKISIKKFLSEETILRFNVDMDSEKIAAEIERTYGKFASGDVAKGIGSVLSSGLEALFGNASGNSNSSTEYFVAVGKLGFPVRVDIFVYSYAFTSDAMIKVTKNVVAISVVVSSVDITDLDEATVGALVSRCYGAADVTIQRNIFDRLVRIREMANTKNRLGEFSTNELNSEQVQATDA